MPSPKRRPFSTKNPGRLNGQRVVTVEKLAKRLKTTINAILFVVIKNDIPIYFHRTNNKLFQTLVSTRYERQIAAEIEKITDDEQIMAYLRRRATLLVDWCGYDRNVMRLISISTTINGIFTELYASEAGKHPIHMPIIAVKNIAKYRHVIGVTYDEVHSPLDYRRQFRT